MKITKLIKCVIVGICLTSCSKTMYQVYEVKSPDLSIKDNSMVYENEDCKVLYNLWAYNGTIEFLFENKTDKDIFINMSQTFFIKNGEAYDYYKGMTFQKSIISSAGIYNTRTDTYWSNNEFWPNKYLNISTGVNIKKAIGTSTSIKEPEFICIPAKSYKIIHYYDINPTLIKSCEKNIANPKTKAIVETYNESNSPLKLKNRIAYSFQKSDDSLKFIENNFWLSNITNYSEKTALEKRKKYYNCSKNYTNVYYFKIGGPNLFFKTYTGNSF